MADERIAHLLRRAGFGASADEVADANTRSYSAAVDRLINYETIPDDVDEQIGQAGYAARPPIGQRVFAEHGRSTMRGSGGCSGCSTRAARSRRR